MQLTPAQRFELYRTALAALASRPVHDWPTTTPPAKDGSAKPAEPPFALACWADRLADAAAYVLTREEAPRDGQGTSARQGGAWPS